MKNDYHDPADNKCLVNLNIFSSRENIENSLDFSFRAFQGRRMS